MGSLIDISAPQVQLRQNRLMLLLIGSSATVFGLFGWSVSPFLWSNPKSQVHNFLRYLSLASSLGCGITAVACGHHLNKIQPLIKALEMSEKNDFYSQLAASQYRQETYWNQQAVQVLTPPTLPVSNVSPTETPPEQVNGLQSKQFSDSETSETSDSDTPDTSAIEAYKPLYKAVTKLKTAGTSDSEIIKELLGGNNGRTYDKAKQQLAALLQLGSEQGW